MNTPTEKQLSVINEAQDILRWCLSGVSCQPRNSWDTPGISMRVEKDVSFFMVWPDGITSCSDKDLLNALHSASLRKDRKREQITKLREEADALESQLSGTDADDGPRMDAAGDAMPQMQEAGR